MAILIRGSGRAVSPVGLAPYSPDLRPAVNGKCAPQAGQRASKVVSRNGGL